ncbi:hypothetical protein ACFL1H_01745 [Nanoarchaeota archaeon]
MEKRNYVDGSFGFDKFAHYTDKDKIEFAEAYEKKMQGIIDCRDNISLFGKQTIAAGFEYFYCAIQQFDSSVLSSIPKRQDKRKIERSMKQISTSGIKLGVSLLYGLPFETKESILATLDYTQENVQNGPIVLVSESVLSYHPGSVEGRKIDFNSVPPNQGFPFNRFEEGQWYHPEHVTKDYLNNILQMSEDRFKNVMVRSSNSCHSRIKV